MFQFYRSLMPKEDRFVAAFGEHARVVSRAAGAFRALMEPGADAASLHETICALEHEADVITQKTVQGVRRSFLIPFDRYDILKLVSATDDIVDEMKTASRRFVRYGTGFSDQMRGMADTVVEATGSLVAIMPLLGNVAAHSETIASMCQTVGGLESRADSLFKEGLQILFPEGTTPADITAQHLVAEQVYDLIENVADRCEDLADVVQGILIEQV